MRLALYVVTPLLIAASEFVSVSHAQVLDGSDLRMEEREREARIIKLPAEEQVKLQAAQEKAVQDPEVIAAIEKRNKALQEFSVVLRETLLKNDPSIQVILDKIAAGASPGY